MTAALAGLLSRLRPESATGALWRSVILFAGCDAFFSGLALAYAFKVLGVTGVLGFIAIQQVFSLLGHVFGYALLRRYAAQRVMRAGVAAFALTLLVGGLLPHGLPSLIGLSVLGGLARGWAWGSRLWQEMHLEKGEARQAYFSAAEAANVSVKLVAPLLTAALLWWHSDVQLVFLGAGVCLLPFALNSLRSPAARLPAPGKLKPWALMRTRGYWRTAPFYVLDGMAHALRTALFVSGALVVVGTIVGYSLVEALSNVVAVALLVWQAHHKHDGPSLKLLKRWLFVLALAWTSLLLALMHPVMLLPYVALFGIGLPLATSQKAALTIQGMTQGVGDRESNSMARSILLVLARVGCIGICLLLSRLAGSPEGAVTAMALLGIGLLPFEYFFARRLAKA